MVSRRKLRFLAFLSILPPEADQRLPRHQTEYLRMLIEYDNLPLGSSLLALFFTWILLAGYLVFPGTFTSINHFSGESAPKTLLVLAVRNLPLLWTAAVCCGIGACGIVWLWWKLRANYFYTMNRLFL
jgi:hypothetical protein